MNKEAKKCIKYYSDYILSEKYRAHLYARKVEGLENHIDYIKENKPEW